MVLVFAMLVSSCAAFRKGDVGPIAAWPPPGQGPASASVNVVVEGPPGPIYREVHEEAVRAFEESALFAEVKSNPERTDFDYIARVRFTYEGRGNPKLAYLSGVTLGLIPVRASDTVNVELSIHSSAGGHLGTVRKSETTTLWIHLVLLPVAPFAPVESTLDSMYSDLLRSALLDAKSQGLLP